MKLKFTSLLATLMLALTAAPSWADSGVHDGGAFFSSDAIQKANDVIHEIKSKHGYDVVVETFPAIPSNLQAKFQSMGKEAFYNDWLESSARAQGVRGVYILAVKDPGHLQIGAGQETRQKAFTDRNRDELDTLMADAFKQKNFDRGLLDGVNYIQRSMRANLAAGGSAAGTSATPAPWKPQTPSRPSGGMFSGFGGILVIGVIILAVIGIIRGLGRRASMQSYGQNYQSGVFPPGAYPPGAYPPGGYPQGGSYPQQQAPGGFLRGMLGGVLGGVAGSYAYDKFEHPDQSGNSNSAPPPLDNNNSSPSVGSDFGSTPDNSSVGSDFGSSADSGSSGGDAGGGGGDSSSTGSDF